MHIWFLHSKRVLEVEWLSWKHNFFYLLVPVAKFLFQKGNCISFLPIIHKLHGLKQYKLVLSLGGQKSQN